MRLDAPGQPVQEPDRGGVGEGVRQGLGQRHPDGPGHPPSQAACGGVRTGVAELPGRVQDPFAERRRQLIGTVIRIGCGRPRHAHDARDLVERDGPTWFGRVGSVVAPAHLNAPAVMPRIMCRWKSTKMMIVGSRLIVAPAISRGKSTA